MIIGTTRLKSVDYGYHKGFYITDIMNRKEAFRIRERLNMIMSDKDILGDVMISDDFKYCQAEING